MHATTSTIPTIDAAIIGGGIAGAWALNLLTARGYNAILLEAAHLGCDQTLASQGMVHGGLKYALSGSVTGASEAIAGMPQRWRACLNNDDDVKLSGAKLLADRYFMFAADNVLGRLTSFFASRSLRGRIDKVPPAEWPEAFHGFNGVVYALNDFVLDTPDLLTRLTHGLESKVFKLTATADTVTAATDSGYVLTLEDTQLHVAHLISCAGNGSDALLQALDIPDIRVQHRPLKQVVVRPRHDTPLFAHCLTGIASAEPRLTITAHRNEHGLIWYLGGQIATQGVDRSDQDQIAMAKQELAVCVPWLDWQGAQYDVLNVDRAEPRQKTGLKPDQAFVHRVGDFIQCFPTKLTLAPDMGDRLLRAMDPPKHRHEFKTRHPRAGIGRAPW